MNPTQFLGESTEMLVASMLLGEGRELYLPAVDDHGVDMIVRTRHKSVGDGILAEHHDFQEIQIKSRYKGGLFAGMTVNPRVNYWFIFYIQDINKFWLINSLDVYRNSSINKPGSKNAGKCSLTLAGKKGPRAAMSQYIVNNFNKLP